MTTLVRTLALTVRSVEMDELFIREWLAPVALFILADGTRDLVDEYYSLKEQLVRARCIAYGRFPRLKPGSAVKNFWRM